MLTGERKGEFYEKEKEKMLQIVSLMLCAAFIVATPARLKAEELHDEELVYYDTEQGRFVNDIDKYLAQLNDGMITPYDSTITDYDSETTPLDLSEPSEKCSNIFGNRMRKYQASYVVNAILSSE